MNKYFEDGYMVQIYEDASGSWSAGNGVWIDLEPVKGYMRVLGSREQTAGVDLITSHRFYTQDSGIEFGNRIVKGLEVYEVKQVNHKKIPTSDLDFYQIECEMVV